MVDLLALGQGFQAIRSASEITQTLIGLRDSAKLLEKTVELNRKIADAQTALFAAQTEQTASSTRLRKMKTMANQSIIFVQSATRMASHLSSSEQAK